MTTTEKIEDMFFYPHIEVVGGDAYHPATKYYYTGAHLSDQFAINAPPAPEWFQPKMETSIPPFVNGMSPDEAHMRKEERNAWRQEYFKQMLIQWPYEWAAIQLQQRRLYHDTRHKDTDSR